MGPAYVKPTWHQGEGLMWFPPLSMSWPRPLPIRSNKPFGNYEVVDNGARESRSPDAFTSCLFTRNVEPSSA